MKKQINESPVFSKNITNMNKASNKINRGKIKALVIDTNFILQYNHLELVLKKLKNKYNLYVPEISVEERISQQTRTMDLNFEEARKSIEKISKYIRFKYLKSPVEARNELEKCVRQKYTSFFGDNIIPIKKDGETFSDALDRSFKKTPPFSSAKDSSDKGFKDTILWLSLISFFKDQGEDEVLFLTNDKAFLNNKDYLIKEFQEKTNKKITIEENSYYSDHLDGNGFKVHDRSEFNRDQIDLLRKRVRSTLFNLCKVTRYEGIEPEKTFVALKEFDNESIKLFLKKLPETIKVNLLKTTIPAKIVFDNDPQIKNGTADISLQVLEDLNDILLDITTNYQDLMDQFIEEVKTIFNQNFICDPKKKSFVGFDLNNPPF